MWRYIAIVLVNSSVRFRAGPSTGHLKFIDDTGHMAHGNRSLRGAGLESLEAQRAWARAQGRDLGE